MKHLLLIIVMLLISLTADAGTYTVERVIDGGTIKLTNGNTVRLIGIDAPESKPNAKAKRDAERTGKDIETIMKMGVESTEFVRGLIKPGQEVRLKFSVQGRDKYGRLLAYVFVDTGHPKYPAPGEIYRSKNEYLVSKSWKHPNGWPSSSIHVFLNATLIKSGYSQPMTIPPNVKYADLFNKLYEEAWANYRGLFAVTSQCETDNDCAVIKGRLVPHDRRLYHSSISCRSRERLRDSDEVIVNSELPCKCINQKCD